MFQLKNAQENRLSEITRVSRFRNASLRAEIFAPQIFLSDTRRYNVINFLRKEKLRELIKTPKTSARDYLWPSMYNIDTRAICAFIQFRKGAFI